MAEKAQTTKEKCGFHKNFKTLVHQKPMHRMGEEICKSYI
jgi:hypothetical protein